MEWIQNPGLSALIGVCLTGIFGLLYRMYLVHDKRRIEASEVSLRGLNAQLDGWVNYSRELTQTIVRHEQRVTSLEEELTIKNSTIRQLTQEILDLQRKIKTINGNGNVK